ncbi:polysaccharide pyruvyl transferase family protein [Sphingobacterium corticis]|uniref:Polysaccharide pyruvyl transferase family protein n=1 Tax=Sphingobacterium corticis TaxID=1812823 RepID=A0ABW5NHC3_9SPHI
MNRVLYYKGYTQYHNIGDQLINKSLLDHFRKHASIVVSDAKMPEFYLQNLEVTEAERVSKKGKGFHGALVADAFNACFDPQKKVYFLASPPGHQFDNSFVTGCKYVLTGLFYLLLNILGVEIIKIGFSIGPLSSMGKIGERFRAWFVRNYYVRDSISLKYAKGIGVNHAKFFPDLCWSYQPNPETRITVPTEVANALPKVVISFRSAVHGESAVDAYEQSLVQILEQISMNYQGQYQFEIAYQVASDKAFSEQLYEKFKSRFPITLRQAQIDLQGAGYYSSADFVLTNRLHVALLAYKFTCLPIILTDIQQHAKINGIFSDAGLKELLVDTQEGTPTALTNVGLVFQNKTPLLAKLQSEESAYHELAINIMSDIFKA